MLPSGPMVPAPPTPPDDDLLSEAYERDTDLAARQALLSEPGALRRVLWPRVAAVLALLVALDAGVRSLLPVERVLPFMGGERAAYTVKLERFRGQTAPDVVVIGSSRSRDGVVPGIMATELEALWGRPVRVYNLGLMGAKAAEWRALIRSHLPDPAPPRVILATGGREVVRPERFTYASRFLWRLPDVIDYLGRAGYDDLDAGHVENYLESLAERAWYLFENRQALRSMALDVLDPWIRSTPQGEDRARRDVNRNRSVAYIDSVDGFNPPENLTLQTLQHRIRHDPESIRLPAGDMDFSPELRQQPRFEFVRESVADLQARGCRVALVEVPASPYLEKKNPVLHGDVFRTRLHELCGELGILFVPMPAERSYLTDGAFNDINHLSILGAERYTQLLTRRLIAAGFFGP